MFRNKISFLYHLCVLNLNIFLASTHTCSLNAKKGQLNGSSIKAVGFEPFLIKCKKQISQISVCQETQSRVALSVASVAVNDKLENTDNEDIDIDGITEFVSASLQNEGNIQHIRAIILFVAQPLNNDHIKNVTAEDPQFS